MKIKTLKLSLFLLALTTVFVSCKKDDGGSGTPFVEADRTEQQEIDNAAILAYLNSHYYNSSFFETGSNHRYTDIIITELPTDDEGNYLDMPDDDNNTLLIDAVELRTATHLEADYEYYVLNLYQGGGDAPKFTDFVRANYEGSSINEEVGGEEEVFDSAVTPEEFNLQTDFTNENRGVIKAWQLVMPTFKSGFVDGIQDGIVNYTDFGLGVMFVPSGLGYFSGVATGKSYDNLIFKFELLQDEVVDHDNDGIPSYIEDLDVSLEVIDDDTDEDGLPNFIDTNDDGDDVLTIDELIPDSHEFSTGGTEPILGANEFEISRSEENGIITINTVTIADSNSDGTPDYLDENISINYNASN